MIRRPPRSTHCISSAASDVYKRQAYDMTCMPNEFNVWILFRSLVDVILLNDVTAYALFSLSHVQGLGNYGVLLFVVRWCIGLLLLAFNAWVKLDAHRVVKDYAWYWGDCFFLCLQNLKFDGVYEVAPDPMYSIGYIGYYGLSLLTGSYMVFFVSLAAHASVSYTHLTLPTICSV